MKDLHTHKIVAVVLILITLCAIGEASDIRLKAHASAAQTVQNPLSWTDMLSGGVWARQNHIETNHTILDSSQAQKMLSSLGPRAPQSQQPPSRFTNNFRVTGNNTLFPTEDEPSIAVSNATGQLLMVVGANSLSTGLMVAYASKDQGTHWTGPIFLPLSRGNDTFASDPALGADRTGIFYYSYLSIGTNFFFPSPIGQDDLVVATSDDGLHWTKHVAVQRTTSPSNSTVRSELFDKPYLAVGPSMGNPATDAVYMTYTDFVDYCINTVFFACKENSTIMQVHSTDRGVTWSKPVRASRTATTSLTTIGGQLVQGSIPAVAQNGDVYTAYYDSGKDGWLNASASIMITKSTDGGHTFSAPTQAALIPQQVTFASAGNFAGFRWWSTMFPSMDIAPDGTVYIAYGAKQSKDSLDPANVYLVASTDGGATWSPPKKINDDSGRNGQFFAWLKASSDGIVHIIWGDQRLDPIGIGYDIFYADATNHGASISTNIRVTDFGTDPLFTFPFVGDYFNIAVYGNQTYPVWTDGRRGVMNLGRAVGFGETDIFTARLGPRDTPSLTIGSSAPAGYTAPVAVSASGLAREGFFVVRMNGVVLPSQKNPISFFFSDKAGSLSDVVYPNSNLYGAYTVELDDWLTGAQLASSTLYVVDTRSLQVMVAGPSTALPGDKVAWSIQLIPPSGSPDQPGFSPTAKITQALLTAPNGQVQNLTASVKATGAGSFSLSTTFARDAAAGSYRLYVSASLSSMIVQSGGIGITTLTVDSEPLNSAPVTMFGVSPLLIYGGLGGIIAVILLAIIVTFLLTRRRERKHLTAEAKTTHGPPVSLDQPSASPGPA